MRSAAARLIICSMAAPHLARGLTLERAPAPDRAVAAGALLSCGHWNGTLAAARELGRAGVPVLLAERRRWSPAARSRYAGERLSFPDPTRPLEHLEALLALGARAPGTLALLAASDDTAFLYAAHAAELGRLFRLDAPPLEALRQVLDKQRLAEHARAAGLRAPRTFFPSSPAEAAALAARAPGPLVIKPRCQVLSLTHSKGEVVAEPGAMEARYAAFQAANRFHPEVLERWPGIAQPMLQEYLPEAASRIYCLSGFVARGGRAALRASLKVLSSPRVLGIGVCFEHAEVDAPLAEAVLALCRRVGYHGVFQCEFLEHRGERLLIDFNPRFYNFMQLDQARGLPQALLAWLAACGQEAELQRRLEQAARPSGGQGMVWCNRTTLAELLGVEALLGRGSRAERRRWREWLAAASAVVDAHRAADDPRPLAAARLTRLLEVLRHPRGFLRSHLAEAQEHACDRVPLPPAAGGPAGYSAPLRRIR